MVETEAAAAKAATIGTGAATGALAPMAEVELEGVRQALTAKSAPVVKAAGAKGVAGAAAGKAATVTGASAKSGAAKSLLFGGSSGTIWTGKGLSLGLGLGLGAWGPVLLVAGGTAAGWYYYNNHYKKKVLEEPSI